MTVKRTLKIVSLVLPLAILYVWQNTQVFKLAYQVNDKAGVYKELLEKNNMLRYNTLVKKSSQEIGQAFFSEERDLKIADSVRIVRVQDRIDGTPAAYSEIAKENRLFRFFSPPAKAESRP